MGKFFWNFIGFYVALVGTIWGFLEAYTYFKDDSLKQILGPYWFLLYVLPILPAAIAAYISSSKPNNQREVLTQQGNLISNQISGEVVGANIQIENYYSTRYSPAERAERIEDMSSNSDEAIRFPSYTSSRRAIEDIRRLSRDVQVLEQRLTRQQKLIVLDSVYRAFREGRNIFEITPDIEREWGFEHWFSVNVPKYLVGRGFLIDETPEEIVNVAFDHVRLTREGFIWYKEQLLTSTEA